MRALTRRQRAFVVHFFDHPDQHYQAAHLAGYKGDSLQLSMVASKLLHNPRMQPALREEAQRRGVLMVPAALKAVSDIQNDPQHRDRLRAAKDTLDRAGLAPVARSQVQVDMNVSNENPALTELRTLCDIINSGPQYELMAIGMLGPMIGQQLIKGADGIYRVSDYYVDMYSQDPAYSNYRHRAAAPIDDGEDDPMRGIPL
jgi:hypothetical protein